MTYKEGAEPSKCHHSAVRRAVAYLKGRIDPGFELEEIHERGFWRFKFQDTVDEAVTSDLLCMGDLDAIAALLNERVDARRKQAVS